MSRTEKRRLARLERERRILDTALELSNRIGCGKMTVEQIAEHADIGKGTIYTHFQSKDELLISLSLAFHQRLVQKLRDQIGAGPITERLQQLISIILKTHLDHPEYHPILQHCFRAQFRQSIDIKLRESLESGESALTQIIRDMLEEGVAQHVFRETSIARLIQKVQTMLFGCIPMIWNGQITRSISSRYLDDVTGSILSLLLADPTVSTRISQDHDSSRELVEQMMSVTRLDTLYATGDEVAFQNARTTFMKETTEFLERKFPDISDKIREEINNRILTHASMLMENLKSFNSGKTYSQLFSEQVPREVLMEMLDYYTSAVGRTDIEITRLSLEKVSEKADSHIKSTLTKSLDEFQTEIHRLLAREKNVGTN